MIKVGVVAAGKAMRIGLREVLNNLPGLHVIAEAAQPQDVAVGEVDVVVAASPTALAFLHGAKAVLLLTDEPDDARELFQEKNPPVWGVLPVNASEAELKIAVEALHAGLWVGLPGLLQHIFTPRTSPGYDDEPEGQPLTEREIEVLQLTAQGLANKQIAVRLGISEHTVKFHLSALYAKLGVSSRTEAVRSGARRGLVIL